MERVGISEDIDIDGRDAFYVHFPELKRIPVKHAGRLSQSIATILSRAQFLQGWHVRMRYSHDHAVAKPQCEKWRKQVQEFNNSCMGI